MYCTMETGFFDAEPMPYGYDMDVDDDGYDMGQYGASRLRGLLRTCQAHKENVVNALKLGGGIIGVLLFFSIVRALVQPTTYGAGSVAGVW